jgi:predicted RNase H-like HicB family nuclease
MQYTVILTKRSDLQWRAFVPGWPDCNAEASTRDEAIDQIRRKLAEAVSHSEIVQIDLSIPNDITSQSRLAGSGDWSDFGIFRNDPTWEQLFTEIENNRNQVLTAE